MKKKIILLLTLILLFPSIVNAGSASLSFSGNGSVTVGKEIQIRINVNSSTDLVGGVAGYLKVSNNNLTLKECNGVSGFNYTAGNNNKVSFLDMNQKGISSGTIAQCSFTANSVGSATISINSLQVTSTSNTNLSGSLGAKTIQILPPPSSNNNLKSLSINPGGINFSPGNTNYNVNVDSNVTSVTISAQAEDSKSSVSGTGTKQLNYGNNKISVNVKAENGATKNYIINVNRKDDRSGDATLKSLNISNGKLNPGFNSGTLEYHMDVPYDVSKLNIDAKANDSKSKVSISNNDLVAEKTTKVEVKVTAENGSTRTYVIQVKRGKDPNKVLSTNNYLSSISVDQGILSPAFNKDQTNYIVYIPYEIDKVNISYEVEDKEYGIAKIDGPSSLGIGENLYKINVTAEDESVKTYNVIINRGRNLAGEVSNNIYLKELKLENGKLTSSFKKEIFFYRYSAKKDFKIEAIPEDEDSNVEIIKSGNIYVILVTAPSGDKATYILIPKEFNIALLIGILMFTITIIGIVVYIIANKRNKKHAKK